MCGRAMLTVSADDLEQTFGFPAPVGYRPRYNIAPSQGLLAISGEGEEQAYRQYTWGLVPFWAKDAGIGRNLVNCRAESIGSKPAFRNAFGKRRCLVIVDGYYEWQAAVGGKRPHRICVATRRPFTLAGIWERWDRGPDPVESCAVITTAANESLSAIHDRMPVIVAPADRAAWLSAATDRAALEALLRPYPGDDLEAYEVSTLMNSPVRDGPECIDPIDPPLSLL